MTEDHIPHSRHTAVDERGRSTEIIGTPLIGFLYIIGIGCTSSTTISEALIISGKGAKFLSLNIDVSAAIQS